MLHATEGGDTETLVLNAGRRALQLTTAGHLDDKTREAVQKAAEDNLRKLITSQNQQQQR